MGRTSIKRSASQGIAMDEFSGGEGDASLIPPMFPADPHFERIMAEDRRRKEKRRRSFITAVVLAVIVVLLLLTAAGVVLYFFVIREKVQPKQVVPIPDNENPVFIEQELKRINCYPEQDGSPYEAWHVTRDICLARGCTYERPRANPSMPVCFVNATAGYRQVDIHVRKSSQRTTEYVLRRLNEKATFGSMISGVRMSVTEVSDKIIRIHAAPDREFDRTGPGHTNFDLADEKLLNLDGDVFGPDLDAKKKYRFKVTNENPFFFQVLRAGSASYRRNPSILWDTEIGGFMFAPDFIQIAGTVSRGSRIYGTGEHRHQTFLRNHPRMSQTWTFFARNQPPFWMPESHLYGAHPFIMVVDPKGLSHGILFYNAAPSEITVNPYPSITWRAVSGLLDIYIFVGPTPDNVIQQYTQLVGRPILPPRWFLDLHVCFSGVEHVSDLERQAVEWHHKRIPWGTLCLRHHGNQRYERLGTYDRLLREWRSSRYNMKKRLTYNLLPHVDLRTRTVTNDVVLGQGIKDAINQLTCIAPSEISKQPYFLFKHFPNSKYLEKFAFWDPLAREINKVMGRYLEPKWRSIKFDSIDLIENQPFIDVLDRNLSTSECASYKLPYTTRAGYFEYSSTDTLSRGTVCASSLHRDCSVPHVDVHNIYGLLMAKAVMDGWLNLISKQRLMINRRSAPVPIMSSSTFPGFGKYGGHWLGQTAATWMSLSESIMSMLEMNWFGVSLVGDWICGEDGPGDLKLCLLWINLASFQPAIRFDYSSERRPTFHALFNKTSYVKAFRRSLTFRKYLTPYTYSQLYEFSLNGIPFWKPLFHIAPANPYLQSEYQNFMLGHGLLVAPVLSITDKTPVQLVSNYKWLHLKTLKEYDFCKSNGKSEVIRNVGPLEKEGPDNYVYLKSGSIVPVNTKMLKILGIKVPPNPRSKDWQVDYGGLHITLLVLEKCHEKKEKGQPLATGTFFWEGGVNGTFSMHVSFSLSRHFALEGKVTFQPPRALHSHLPPGVPRPPSRPWPFEVFIDHIIFFSFDTTANLGPVQRDDYENESADVEGEVKVDVRQAVAGDNTQLTTRESYAIDKSNKKILFASNISIPLPEGDFSVVLVPRSKHRPK